MRTSQFDPLKPRERDLYKIKFKNKLKNTNYIIYVLIKKNNKLQNKETNNDVITYKMIY